MGAYGSYFTEAPGRGKGYGCARPGEDGMGVATPSGLSSGPTSNLEVSSPRRRHVKIGGCMRKLIGALAVLLCCSLPALTQQHPKGGSARGGGGQPPAARPEVGGGHIAAHGPAPSRAPAPPPAPSRAPARAAAPAQRTFADAQGHPNAPHVHSQGDQWVGHDTGAGDPHYHLAQPWAHGHFPGNFGPSHVY